MPDNITPTYTVNGHPGMSLRTWIAGQALPAIINFYYGKRVDQVVFAAEEIGLKTPFSIHDFCAKSAVLYADAMIAEGDKEIQNEPPIVPQKSYMDAIREQMEKMIKERQIAHDKFTQDQLADLFIQILKSGDVMAHVRASDSATKLTYIPYDGVESLREKNSDLRSTLVKLTELADNPVGREMQLGHVIAKAKKLLGGEA